MATTPTTELDFDQIKADIISFMKNDPTFTDYNFEGSALNSIVDMLAYNTHTNAYYANMLHNEGFIDTAQKRSSVVSKAKELGYTPRSVVGSTAYVNITILDTVTPIYYLTRGTTLSSSNDAGTFTFVVASDYVSTTIETGKIFPSVKLVAGVYTNNYFIVDTLSNVRSTFTIPNKNIDVSTLRVFVKDSISSIERSEYFISTGVYDSTPGSRVFYIQESYSGYYQIYFGGDIIGKQPINGNVIDIDYVLSDDLDTPNGCRTFAFDGTFGSSPLNIETTQVSFAGADRESIDSIRVNAVKSNSTKNRSVTATDYELILKNSFNFIKSVSVWGGEDNVPPVYGRVFIALQPVTGYTVSDAVKTDIILPIIKNTSLITVLPVFLDPTYTSLDFITSVKFNQQKSYTTTSEMEVSVKSAISSYVSSLSSFGVDYLESNLLNKLLGIDPGISSISINKRVGFKLTPLIGIESSHVKTLNSEISQGSITSSIFQVYYDGIVSVTIKEISGDFIYRTNSAGLQETIQSVGLYSTADILIKTIGTVNLNTGSFDISFGVYAYTTASRFINVRCNLVDNDIIVARNQILIMDTDVEDLVANIPSNNLVVTEVYGK